MPKTPRPFLKFEGPVVAMFETKDDPYVVACNTLAELHAAALTFLQERFEMGWYWKPAKAPTPPEEVEEATLTTLPKSLRDDYKETVERFKRAMRFYENTVEEYEAIERAVEEKDGEAALRLLQARASYEHENLQIFQSDRFDPLSKPKCPRKGRVWVDPETDQALVFDGEKWIPQLFVDLEHNITVAQGKKLPPPKRRWHRERY